MQITTEKLKKLLKEAGIISHEQLARAEKLAQKEGKLLADVLVERSFVEDAKLGKLVAKAKGVPFINLRDKAIPEEVLKIVPREVAESQQVIAFQKDKEGIKVAMADPNNMEMRKWLEKKSGANIVSYYATPRDIQAAVDYYKAGFRQHFDEVIKKQIKKAKAEGMEPEDLPIIKTLDSLIEYAYINRASDIHIEPHSEKLIIRFRIDGILHDIVYLPKEIKDLIITRVKILAKLRTDEHRAAQDGKFSKQIEGDRFDVRVSVIPITEGEKVAMRLLSERAQQFSLEDLGFQDRDLEKMNHAVKRPHGMILATGPTGCGKTTTLYSILKILNDPEVNISTIEDPVEYDIERVNQIQINPATNLTFAEGLRSIVRQDPDIIMVGEIRDEETADIAVNAAMTGHLVLSTLHTNDAPTAFPRLMEMRIKPFLIASSVNIVVAQRLVRRICKNCVQSYSLSLSELEVRYPKRFIEKFVPFDHGKELKLYKGKGCRVCGFSGYKGRVGIFEVLEISDEIKELVMKEANAAEIRKVALKNNFNLMIDDGVKKVKDKATTIDEVLRVTRE